MIYALPWDLDDESAIRLFAEDDAGNRVETAFLDLFKSRPPRTDDIQLTDGFLERVVPAIASRTAGFDDSGSLLDQYLEINGNLRQAELDRVVARIVDVLTATGPANVLLVGPAGCGKTAAVPPVVDAGQKTDDQKPQGPAPDLTIDQVAVDAAPVFPEIEHRPDETADCGRGADGKADPGQVGKQKTGCSGEGV